MTLNKTLSYTLATAGMVVAGFLAVPAIAQETAAPAEVSDVELDAFVVAVDEVMSIEQSYATRLAEADGDEAQQQQLMEEARAEMVAAVNETPDIDVERYVEIIDMGQNGPELRAALTDRIEN